MFRYDIAQNGRVISHISVVEATQIVSFALKALENKMKGVKEKCVRGQGEVCRGSRKSVSGVKEKCFS